MTGSFSLDERTCKASSMFFRPPSLRTVWRGEEEQGMHVSARNKFKQKRQQQGALQVTLRTNLTPMHTRRLCAHLEQFGREVDIRFCHVAHGRISPSLNDLLAGAIVAHVSPNVLATMELQEVPPFKAKLVDQLVRNPHALRFLSKSKPICILTDELEKVLIAPVAVDVSFEPSTSRV